MNKLNVEIKAKCENPQKILEVLRSFNADDKGIDHQIDTYFNVPEGRLKLREGNIENSLIFYKRNNQAGPKQSHVTMTVLPPKTDTKSVLADAYGIKVEVDKKRHILFVDNVKFHIDDVEKLGSFCEIEAIDERGTIGSEKLLEQCEKFMELFGIKKEHLVECSYSDLLLKS
jgi:adenylate cyclase class 2